MNKWQHLYLLNVDEFQRFCKTGLLALYGRNMGEITADRFSDPELANDLELIDHLFSQCPSVEDLSDWVIISMNRQSMFAEYAEIDDVTAVFALDERSRLIISQKLFDRRIKIRPPLFNPNMLCRIVARKKRYSGTRADELLWKILDLPHGDIKIDCMKAVTYKDISRANTDALTGRGVFGEDTSIWSSLLRYERRMDFPQGLLGFFYDSVLIFFSHIAAVCKPRSYVETVPLSNVFLKKF